MEATFAEFAKKVVLFCHITWDPKQKFLREKGGSGFPYLVFMDAEGNVLFQPGGRSVKAFEKTAKTAVEYCKAKAAAEKGDKAAKIEFIFMEMSYGKVDRAAGEAKLKELGELSEAQKKKLEEALFNIEVSTEVKGVGRGDKAKVIAAGKKFHEWHKAGKVPALDDLLDPFYIFIMDYTESEQNAVGFEEALGLLKKKYGDDPDAKGFFTKADDRLKKLKASK